MALWCQIWHRWFPLQLGTLDSPCTHSRSRHITTRTCTHTHLGDDEIVNVLQLVEPHDRLPRGRQVHGADARDLQLLAALGGE